MTIKRYTPRYKVLGKFKKALLIEKRGKIAKFNAQKWEVKRKIYFPRALKTFDQDSATFVVGDSFDSDRNVRLKKTYKYILQDKQAFQLYYGGRRLRDYQLKQFASMAKKLGQIKSFSSGRALHFLMENRLGMLLHRLGYTASLMQSRKLISSGYVCVDNKLVNSLNFSLKHQDLLKMGFLDYTLARYLKYNVPFFYFQKKFDCKLALLKKKRCTHSSFIHREKFTFYSFFKKSVELQINRVNGI